MYAVHLPKRLKKRPKCETSQPADASDSGSNAGSPAALYACNTDGGTTLSADGEKVTKIPSGESLEALNDLLFRKIQLIPRGALITSFLRLLFADLFVHGTGGGNYDQFTDRFIETWWNVQPPPFVVATASRFLFAERRSRISELQKLQKHLRDLRFNPQRHFGIRQANEAWKCQLS